MHDVAVVDASPLIFLGDIGRLELLRLAARKVVVPEAVRREVFAFGPDDPAAAALNPATWIQSTAPEDVASSIAEHDLGGGESQVLAVASALPRAVAIMDDLAGRRCARAHGIALRGTLGLVLVARQMGEIAAARPLVEELRRAGMYLSQYVIDRALREVDE